MPQGMPSLGIFVGRGISCAPKKPRLTPPPLRSGPSGGFFSASEIPPSGKHQASSSGQTQLSTYSRRFSREPVSAEDYHRKSPSKAELDAAFRKEQERVISNDWVVQYQGRFLQIERESRYARRAAK